MKILILGKGFISEYLVKYLNGSEHSVDCYSREELDYSDDTVLYNKIVDQADFGEALVMVMMLLSILQVLLVALM